MNRNVSEIIRELREEVTSRGDDLLDELLLAVDRSLSDIEKILKGVK